LEGDAPSSPQLRNLGLADPKNNFAEHVPRGEPLVRRCERVDSRDRYLELRLVHGTIKALELVDAGNGVVKLQLSQRFREPRRQRIGASPGDKERNCNQQLHERVFCAALPHVKTVWEVHQKDRSEHDDDDARRAKSDQNAAQNRQPAGKLCQPRQER
jgi:hypothetical protein